MQIKKYSLEKFQDTSTKKKKTEQKMKPIEEKVIFVLISAILFEMILRWKGCFNG